MNQAHVDFLMSIDGIQTHTDSFSEVDALLNLEHAVRFIPAAEKQAFVEATRLCPEIIKQESDPMLFLAREGFDSWKAAVRLAKYWATRMELCGPDRAFRPIFDLSGEGALLPSTVDLIATGLGVILPPDEQGHPVWFVDRSRAPPELHVETVNRRQLGFYFLTKIMILNPTIVVILFLSAKPRFVPGTPGWFTDIIMNAFPLKIHAVHIVCRSPRSAFQRFVDNFVPLIMRLASKCYGFFNLTLDIGEKDELRKKLMFYGMLPESLPEVVDGTWTYDVFYGWIESEKEKSRARSSTGYSPRLATDVSQDSSEVFGLELLAAAAEHKNRGKYQSYTEVVENETKNDEESGLPNKTVPIRTGMTTGKVHASDDEAATGTSLDKLSMNRSMIDGHHSRSLFSDGSESVRRELNGLSPKEKASYCEAIRHSPNLVKAELDLAAFLFVEGGNAQTAATRVASCWNIRKSLFKERAYLPLQQSGDGALNSDDLRVLKCGYITLLPKDRKGRNVVCCDASRLEKNCYESRLRCLFYMLHVAMKDSSDMKDVAILLIMNKLSFERTREHSSLTQLLRVFPVKLAAIHIVRQPARLGARFFEEKVVPTLKSLFCSLNVAIYGHSGTPECDLRKQMAQYDFDSENLPRSLGGGWTYQDFTQWREQRLIVERTSTLQLNSDSPHVHETEPCHDEASPCLGTPLRGNSALSRVQLVPVLDRAQSGPERLLENELTDQVMNLTWQLYDPCDQSQLTDQTIMQLHKANRFQHEGGSGQMDSCAVEWLQGRPVANAQSLRSDAKTASDIGAGGHFLTTQRWSNGLVNSVPTGLNVTARRLDEGDPLISHGSMFPASNLNPQQKREHGAYMNLFPAAHNFNIFSSK